MRLAMHETVGESQAWGRRKLNHGSWRCKWGREKTCEGATLGWGLFGGVWEQGAGWSLYGELVHAERRQQA